MQFFESSPSRMLWAALALLVLICPLPARADAWQASAAVASDKVQRGVSESQGQAVWLLDLGHAWDNGLSLAAGAAGPVYQAQGGQGELSVTLSKAWQLDADWLAQLAASRYEVAGQPRARAYRYKELYASLAWRGRVTLALAASPDTSRFVPGEGLRTGRVWAVEMGVHQRLLGRLALDVGAGYLDQGGLQSPGYGYGSVGLSWSVGPVQTFVSCINSQARAVAAAGAAQAGPRWVATVVWTF
jgi:hypothetical protein